ncbi:hypothetical protein SADUNF_Sadunf06G0188500 [Salix dunnii]|uniref:Uncharacterized protein n=1 Tax=Salix dunnii TaxID=1413687 RepID=A0A835N163_9ROSI|nr:hypothetical protein SADUNF_Sadunf06G0188500 [Salix dunnii]
MRVPLQLTQLDPTSKSLQGMILPWPLLERPVRQDLSRQFAVNHSKMVWWLQYPAPDCRPSWMVWTTLKH